MAIISRNITQPSSVRGTMLSSMLYLLLGGLLAISVHLTLDKVIQAQAKVAHEVNVSGQQRMLLQRASLFATAYLYSGDIAAKQTSLQALGEMQANHQHLLNPHYNALKEGHTSPMSFDLQQLYFTAENNVNEQLMAFSEQIYHALNLQEQKNGAKLDAKVLMEMAYTPLLNSLNGVVRQYESQDSERMATLILVQMVVFWLIVAILFVGLLLILLNAKKQHQKTVISRILNRPSDQSNSMFSHFAFELSATKLIATAHRHNESMSVLAFDIDRFPRILANHGQDVADKVLTRVADTLLSTCRESDYLGQVADEKFVLLLPRTSAEQALCLANKIRLQFQQELANTHLNEISLSVSIGVSELAGEDSILQHIISRAEQALGRKKNEGGGRVCLA
ncbi:GGDEF domain-containing protein [Paraglaciecola polaris]|uniref:diguanylate cyclase n=1 Tax=Paraglaciecola polaris LMG 21857 TaxID=1129793 RepID=K7A8B0_9ALTE|nr:GGDEF domain-containing protein [Paraglaciecola polaris]GAC31675.1 diguanylate cyclase [Paraglaciecola polaris LMG 21857]|tara:strand:- start:6927 stop:8108 length:1182 start_codon:yes stop_codon:yes gene_type:complete